MMSARQGDACMSCGGDHADEPREGCGFVANHARAALDPPEAPVGPEWAPDVAQALETIAEALGAAVAPLAAAFQDARDEALAVGRDRDEAVVALGRLLGFIDYAGVQPNWAKDRTTLEEARALYARHTEETKP